MNAAHTPLPRQPRRLVQALALATVPALALAASLYSSTPARKKGFNIGIWFGVLAPAATPKDVLARLNTEMVKVIQSPEFRKRMDEIGAEPVGNSAGQMAQQIKAETEKFAKLVKDGNVIVD